MDVLLLGGRCMLWFDSSMLIILIAPPAASSSTEAVYDIVLESFE